MEYIGGGVLIVPCLLCLHGLTRRKAQFNWFLQITTNQGTENSFEPGGRRVCVQQHLLIFFFGPKAPCILISLTSSLPKWHQFCLHILFGDSSLHTSNFQEWPPLFNQEMFHLLRYFYKQGFAFLPYVVTNVGKP